MPLYKQGIGSIAVLTAIVPTALWSAGKKYGAKQRHVMDTREEQKHLRMKQNNLLIQGFKPSASHCLLTAVNKKITGAANCCFPLIFRHINNTAG